MKPRRSQVLPAIEETALVARLVVTPGPLALPFAIMAPAIGAWLIGPPGARGLLALFAGGYLLGALLQSLLYWLFFRLLR